MPIMSFILFLLVPLWLCRLDRGFRTALPPSEAFATSGAPSTCSSYASELISSTAPSPYLVSPTWMPPTFRAYSIYLFGGAMCGDSVGPWQYLSDDLWRVEMNGEGVSSSDDLVWTHVSGRRWVDQTALASSPPGGIGHAGLQEYSGGGVYLFGGYVVTESLPIPIYNFTNQIWHFDGDSTTWTETHSQAPTNYGMLHGSPDPSVRMPPAAFSSILTLTGTGVADGFVFGGLGPDGELYNHLFYTELLDGDTSWVGGTNVPNHPGACCAGGVFDLGVFPSSRYGSTLWWDSVFDYRLFLFGGVGAEGKPMRDLWTFSYLDVQCGSPCFAWVVGTTNPDFTERYTTGLRHFLPTWVYPDALSMTAGWSDSEGRLYIISIDKIWSFDLLREMWTVVELDLGMAVNSTTAVFASLEPDAARYEMGATLYLFGRTTAYPDAAVSLLSWSPSQNVVGDAVFCQNTFGVVAPDASCGCLWPYWKTETYGTCFPDCYGARNKLDMNGIECGNHGSCVDIDTCVCSAPMQDMDPLNASTSMLWVGSECEEGIGVIASVSEGVVVLNYQINVTTLLAYQSIEPDMTFDCLLAGVVAQSSSEESHLVFGTIPPECWFEEDGNGWIVSLRIRLFDAVFFQISSTDLPRFLVWPMLSDSPVAVECIIPSSDPPSTSNLAVLVGSVVGGFFGVAILVVLVVFVILLCICLARNKRIPEKTPTPKAGLPDSRCLSSEEIVISDFFNIPFEEVELLEEIGKGGGNATACAAFFLSFFLSLCFQIYKASWQDSIVALKIFQSANISLSEFQREAQMASSLHHPHILQCFGFSSQLPRIGIVMEYCVNGDLRSYLVRSSEGVVRTLLLAEKLRLSSQLSSVLDFLHSKSIIHRDVKLVNVLLDEQLDLKLIDFGLAKLVAREKQAHTRAVGTSVYIAPEIIQSSHYDFKVDVFAMGIFMYCLFTENLQPYGDDPFATPEYRVANDDTYRPSFEKIPEDKVPPAWLQQLIVLCWSGDPDDRPSAEGVQTQLKSELEKMEAK